MNNTITVDHLSKTFSIKKNLPGISGAIKGLFRSPSQEVAAIKTLSFSIKQGESVAFIGPNGSGKSTTIKILTGILYPTSGDVRVLGLVPWKQRRALGFQIGTVFGQRSQLWYHLPPSDTFYLLSKIYELPTLTYKKSLEKLVDSFEISSFLDQPVRQLSLGQRMRCEIVASLLHQPKILFLDEPTIGLDINAKLVIRDLLQQLSKDHGTTLFLTSHDTADIEHVCSRVIVLDQGLILSDSNVRNLKKMYTKKKVLKMVMDQKSISLEPSGIKISENANHHFTCEIDTYNTNIDQVIQKVLKCTNIQDITIEDPSMDETIRMIYKNNAK